MFYNTKNTNSNIARAGKYTVYWGMGKKCLDSTAHRSNIFFFSIPALLIIFDTSSVALFVSQTVEGQEKVLYMCHLWTHVDEDLDPWPYECFLFYGDELCLVLLVHVIKNSQVSHK